MLYYETERPGDSMTFGLGALMGGNAQPQIATGTGSEIRFVGTIQGDGLKIIGAQGSRLVFRKVKGKLWAYVSGLGSYQSHGKLTKLGYDRTVDSCLALLKSRDPILREGAARDLGRLTTSRDAARVVSRLMALLERPDPSVAVRRGAIEGLGLIGTRQAGAFLRSRDSTAKDETTRKFIHEALGFCAAYALLGEPDASAKPDQAGLAYLLTLDGSPGSWFADNLRRRTATHRKQAMAALARAEKSDTPGMVHAAKLIEAMLINPDSAGS